MPRPWMRRSLFFALSVLSFLLPAHISAQSLLVDTGAPSSLAGGESLCGKCGGGTSYQDVAGQFTLPQTSPAYSISSVQGWMQGPEVGGQLSVVIRTDNSGLPGQIVYTQTFTEPNLTQSQCVMFPLTNQPILSAGTPYWLSFEPVPGNTISYAMPGGAPSPLASYAFFNSLNNGWITASNPTGYGMRISGTPAAAPSLLVDTGMAGSSPNGSYTIFYDSTFGLSYLAGQFVLDQAATITDIKGWMQVFSPGTINVKIYTNNTSLFHNIVPGNAIFSQTYSVSATFSEGWIDFPIMESPTTGFPVLPAGTYWVSFEPILGGGFNAGMAPGAPNPLPGYAYLVTGNIGWFNNPLDLGMQVYGTTFAGLASGTAARTIMTGNVFGLPFSPQDYINGGDGQLKTNNWNFVIPAGWSYGGGSLTQNALSAGGYTATSGNAGCTAPAQTCGVGAGRGVAYRTWKNTTNLSLTFRVNAELDGGFNYSGGVASAGIHVFDSTAFTNTVAGSGVPAPQFFLNGSTLSAMSNPVGLDVAHLFPPSAVLLDDFQTFSSNQPQFLPGVAATIPLTSSLITVQPNQAITVMFDVSAYAPAFGTASFANTLKPSSTLPLFTDVSGNSVTQLVALGPSVPLTNPPAAITMAPSSASDPVGTNGSVTATVTDSTGNPVTNTNVFFAFNSGPNAGPAGPITTDSNGQANFAYTGNGGAGTDVIQASIGSLTSNTASITWTIPGPLDHIVISPANATINTGGSQSYTAAAFDKFNNPIGDVSPSTVFTISPDGSCTGASCTVTAAGPHTVTGTYSGKSAQASLQVIAGKQNSSSVVTSNNNPSVFGQSVTFTATVTAVPSGGGTPTGTVNFMDGATTLASGVTLSGGVATFSTSTLSVGTHSITAVYGGDANFNATGAGTSTATAFLQQVKYGVCLAYDPTRSVKSGATFPLRMYLCDANGNDLSSSGIVLHATSVFLVSGYTGTPEAAGSSNPDNDFRYDSTIGPSGGYIFNLQTTGLASGTYGYTFTATNDPTTHSVMPGFGVN